MLSFLAIASGLLTIVSGVAALFLGDWRQSTLKFAALSLSVVVSLMMFILPFVAHAVISCQAEELFCANITLYRIARNIVLILFHAILLQEALQQRRVRGVTLWKKNLQS